MEETKKSNSARRKNIAFNPLGKNPVHDAAIRILSQFGRGRQNDFIAEAIVHYASSLAHGNVPHDFFKSFGIDVAGKAKVVFIGEPVSTVGKECYKVKDKFVAPHPTEERGGIARNNSIIETPPSNANEQAPVLAPTQSQGEVDTDNSMISPTSNTSLPPSLIQNLVSGFDDE